MLTKLIRISTTKPRAVLATALTAVIVVANFGVLPGTVAQAETKQLIVSANFADKQSVTPLEQIDLRLSRPLPASEGRLAVFIGQTDMTALFTATENGLSYTPKSLPLPGGESPVTVYLVSPSDDWKEIARFALRVSDTRIAERAAVAPLRDNGKMKRLGFDKLTAVPTLTLGVKSQPAEFHFPDSNRLPRSTFADLTLQGSVRSEMARGGFNSQTQFEIVGSSFRQEALRFATERNDAPNIDLASYLMQFQIGKSKLSVGHLAFGSNRQLINNFSSRGISLTTPITRFADVTLAAMNGTSIVGWSNFLGLSKSNHRFVTGTAGFEFIPERRGELRFELSVLDGQLQPVTSFNQGSITDTERSRGLGARLLGSDPKQRWRFDAGFARSRFTNPADQLLFQGFNVVPVREATRDARYFDGAFNLLQNARLSDAKRANVTVNYNHERIDPLFKSVAAFTQPDRSQNQIDVVAAIGDLTAAVTHLRFNDNLRNVPSVLKSLSRRTGLILGAPLSSLLGNPTSPSPWLPRVSYSIDETHQFAPSRPVNGGFEVNPSTVPDQVSINQNLSAEWQRKGLRWAYRFNRSFQDNRQVGRELADLRNITNVWSLGAQASARLSVYLDVGWDSALNKEQRRTDRTFRVGPSFNWNITKSMVFAGTVSATSFGNVAGTSRNRSSEVDLQWSYRFANDEDRNKKVHGQFFIRYANRYAFASDSVFGFRNLTKLQTLNTGINFTFF